MTIDQLLDNEKYQLNSSDPEQRSLKVVLTIKGDELLALESAADALAMSVNDYIRHCYRDKLGLSSVFLLEK